MTNDIGNLDLGKEAFIAFNLSLLKNHSQTFPSTRNELEIVWDKAVDEERKQAWQNAALKIIEVSNGQA